MLRRRGIPSFPTSEPEYLISCLDRHKDWALIVCLVGGGQEINVGEAGIREWLNAIATAFPLWEIHVSPELKGKSYEVSDAFNRLSGRVTFNRDLHLAVSMRSFRAESVSTLVGSLLEFQTEETASLLNSVRQQYPIALTRSLSRAKQWVRSRARGNERFGLMVSSSALRLKPCAIDVRAPVDPVTWFLEGKQDVRSSLYLEDAATEFQVQGLELDWGCVVWDGDLRYSAEGWQHMRFKGSRWERVNKSERRMYLENAYRVLLTRARQGMIIVVPEGDESDPTRHPAIYDPTFNYLARLGIGQI